MLEVGKGQSSERARVRRILLLINMLKTEPNNRG